MDFFSSDWILLNSKRIEAPYKRRMWSDKELMADDSFICTYTDFEHVDWLELIEQVFWYFSIEKSQNKWLDFAKQNRLRAKWTPLHTTEIQSTWNSKQSVSSLDTFLFFPFLVGNFTRNVISDLVKDKTLHIYLEVLYFIHLLERM